MGWGPKAPDMKGVNAAAIQNAEIGREQLGLARAEFADAKARQDKFDPLFERLINSSMASQATNDQRSADQWRQYTDVFMPAERRLADTAANYDTAGRRDAAGAEAVAGVDAQFDRARQAQQRDLGRAGVSMSSGRALTLDSAQRFAQAKAGAGADRAARNQVEATGMSLTDNVVKTGRGIASTGLQAAGLALNAGNSGSGQLGQQQATYNASMAPGAALYGGAAGATSAAGSLYGTAANIQAQNNQATMTGLAGLGQLAGTALFLSDQRSKTKQRVKVSGQGARLSLEDAPVTRWKYRQGHGDGGEHIGRMASKGDPKGPDGMRRIDVISEVGKHHAAIADISKDVKALKKAGAGKRLSLADAKDRRAT